jgi:thymidine kinase
MTDPTSTPGRLTVIGGPMFAGKSGELLPRVRRRGIAGARVAVVSHAWDTRQGDGVIATHDGGTIPARGAASVEDIDAAVAGALADGGLDLVAIDEAQFFGADLRPCVERLLARGIDVLVAGLCVTFDAEPFAPLPDLMALAEETVKLTAVCVTCGRDASFHERIERAAADSPDDLGPGHVGGTLMYAARCREHHPAFARA